jgi:DNA-binding NtrC family response regulator
MSDSAHKNIRVLLVDDEADLVDFLAQRLTKRSFTVRTATSGQEAVDAASEAVFDVAVVDLKMPQMDGIAVMKELRDRQPYIEAIMLTGHGSPESALEAGRLHAFRYLIKPYDFDKLIEQIEEAASERRARLREDFQRKLDEVINSNASPREIIVESERLRREYEQD